MAKIGQFELLEEIASGGMATVWRARGADGRLAAVKLMRSELASDESFRQALRNEVHLTARLNHPGIIRLHTWGEATDVEAESLGLATGAPWIAMDLADRPFTVGEVNDWAGFMEFARSVLSALMHSHARGVIHRDIKPSNILIAQREGSARFVVSDFGIAFPHRQADLSTREVRAPSAGTLNYMAPEQLLGRWRDFGPYTDLFSVGVLFYEVATGYLPFDARSRIDLGLQHQRGAAATGTTRFGVPSGFREWVATLICFDPRGRFAFAADAAHGLALLGAPDGDAPIADPAGRSQEIPTRDWTNTPTAAHDPTHFAPWGATIHIGGPLRAPAPDDWRKADEPAHERVEVGVDLFGLRRAPMTGRESERTILWEQLADAVRENRGRGVVLRGPAGVGKSSLARWLCERAHELGVADSTQMTHSPGTSSIPSFLRQEFQLWGLTPDRMLERLAEILEFPAGDPDMQVLERLVQGESVGLAEQTLVLRRLLKFFTARRPVIVWLDDAHWSLDAIEAAARLTPLEGPLLFVLTVRDEDLANLPVHAAQIESYSQMPEVREIRVPPLADENMRQLLDDSLALDESLRETLIADARGNPLRALQALQLSLQQGRTTVNEAGRVCGDVTDESTEAVWMRRAREAVGMDLPSVVAAAVLGHQIQLGPWQAICADLEIDVDVSIANRLVEAGLWVPESEFWLFAHGSLRDALLADAAHSQLCRDAHRAAARLYDPKGSQTFIQHGFHRIRAGALSEGIEVLLDGLSVLYSEGRALTARSVMANIRAHMENADVDELTQARFDVAEAGVAFESERHGEALWSASLALDTATRRGWWDVAAKSQIVRACVFEARRELQAALDASQAARELARRANRRDLEDRAACRLGWAFSRLSQFGAARDEFTFAAQSDDDVVSGRALVGLAHTCEALGDLDEAARALDSCIHAAREAGRRAQLADALNSRASVASLQGMYPEAVACYEEAHLNAQIERSAMSHIIPLNWAVLLARMGDGPAARQMALSANIVEMSDNPFLHAYGELVLLLAAAVVGSADDWATNAAALDEPRFEGDIEFAEIYALMSDAWIAHGDRARAAQAREAALRTLGDITGPRADAIRG